MLPIPLCWYGLFHRSRNSSAGLSNPRPLRLRRNSDLLILVAIPSWRLQSFRCSRLRRKYRFLQSAYRGCSLWLGNCLEWLMIRHSTNYSRVSRNTKVSPTIWKSKSPSISTGSAMPIYLMIQRRRYVPCCAKYLNWRVSETVAITLLAQWTARWAERRTSPRSSMNTSIRCSNSQTTVFLRWMCFCSVERTTST